MNAKSVVALSLIFVVCLAHASAQQKQSVTKNSDSEPPTAIKTSDVAPVEDLAAEAEAKLSLLAGYVANEKSYRDASRDHQVQQAAGVLSCLAQAIAQHDKKAAVKIAAPDLRDAALALRDSKLLPDAQAALKNAQAAWSGKSTGNAHLVHDWSKLIDFDLTMEEIKERNNKIRRIVRRPSDPLSDSLHATTLAVLALTIAASSDGVDKVQSQADKKKWKEYAGEYQKSMTAAAAALKKKDSATAKKLWLAGVQSCNNCHRDFQDQ